MAIRYTRSGRMIIAEFEEKGKYRTVYGKDLFAATLNNIYNKEMKIALREVSDIFDVIDPRVKPNPKLIESFIKEYGYPIGRAKCHPDDEFDEKEGKKIAFEKLIVSEYQLVNKFYLIPLTKLLYRVIDHIGIKFRSRAIAMVKRTACRVAKENQSKPKVSAIDNEDDSNNREASFKITMQSLMPVLNTQDETEIEESNNNRIQIFKSSIGL